MVVVLRMFGPPPRHGLFRAALVTSGASHRPRLPLGATQQPKATPFLGQLRAQHVPKVGTALGRGVSPRVYELGIGNSRRRALYYRHFNYGPITQMLAVAIVMLLCATPPYSE